MKVPRVMSTQHPDNVRQPFFCDGNVFNWEDEIKEAFYVYSHLKCNEQLWDYEGKEVDNFVVKKLLTRYENFFRKKTLGEDLRLTVRVPNPSIEKTEGLAGGCSHDAYNLGKLMIGDTRSRGGIKMRFRGINKIRSSEY